MKNRQRVDFKKISKYYKKSKSDLKILPIYTPTEKANPVKHLTQRFMQK